MSDTLKKVFESKRGGPLLDKLNRAIESHPGVIVNPPRQMLVKNTLRDRKAIALGCGALAVWSPAHSTGRSPKDTYLVKRAESGDSIDWSSSYINALSPDLFDSLWEDGLKLLKEKPAVYVSERVIGADSTYALPVRVVVDQAISQIFILNMFRPVPEDLDRSVFAGDAFTLLALPYDYVQDKKYRGRLREVNGRTSRLMIAMDCDRKLGLIMGSCYQGSLKKTLFTVMNYLLPEKGILPLHCSANKGQDGSTALFLGLSGSGKTTVSADHERTLLGDDEFGWGDSGIANFENGCYAKLVHINPDKEPDIYQAAFRKAAEEEQGALIENLMVYPDGSFDVDDTRLTENSRVSYPLSSLNNADEGGCGTHPKNIIFLAADANGVLPPIARLTTEQAVVWFLLGYTSKLAGTERGVKEPVPTFSRFFGGPFMARKPRDYIRLFREKISKHGSSVYLVNTGWTGGSYGVGSRFDINVTRAVIKSIVDGGLKDAEFLPPDPFFHLSVPKKCPGVDSNLLQPVNTWVNKEAYRERAERLAGEFAAYFDMRFGLSGLSAEVVAMCPGK